MNTELFQQINCADYIVLDIKTTGLSAETDKIIEISIAKFHQSELVETFNSKINPRIKISHEITEITGLTDADLHEAPLIEEELPRVYDFIGDLPIVGHHVDFHVTFLEYNIRLIQDNLFGWQEDDSEFIYTQNELIDTLLLTRILYPFFSSYSLDDICEHFKITSKLNAERVTELFQFLTEEIAHRGIKPLQYMVKLFEPIQHPMKRYFVDILNAKLNGQFDESRDLLAQSEYRSYYNIIGKNNGDVIDDAESVDDFFKENGLIAAKLNSFEYRDEQFHLARKIDQALNQHNFLVSEAGTGTGKSMAYLIPSALFALKNRGEDGRVIISTNTKNLQEQLFYKDIPFVHGLIGRDFLAVLLKGKGNYLCLDKWYTHFEDSEKELSYKDRVKIASLVYWMEYTQTGDIVENQGFNADKNGFIWQKFIAENNYCSGKQCTYYNDCHLIRIRNQARAADLLVVNHSLLFSNLSIENSLIGDVKHIVFDEAHHIEKTATDYLGAELTIWSFRRLLKSMYKQSGKVKKGLFFSFERRLAAKQDELDDSLFDRLLNGCVRIQSAVSKCEDLSELFFQDLSMHLRTINHSQSQYEKIIYRNGEQFFQPIWQSIEDLNSQLEVLSELLLDFLENCRELLNDTLQRQLQMIQEVKSAQQTIQTLLINFGTLTQATLEDFVFWAEKPRKTDQYDSKLFTAPIKINDLLNQLLFSKLNSTIFTSATASVNNRFDYFEKRIGLDRLQDIHIDALQVSSSFDYREQMDLKVSNFLPDPQSHMYLQRLIDLLIKVCEKRDGGILILFTSYYMLNESYHALKNALSHTGRKIIAQGISGSRSGLTQTMIQHQNTILLGTDSFWEGVDLQGKSLETLVITKIPFDVPSEPVISAKMQAISDAGGNPFMEYSVPEAVLKLRQGVGRLIRSKQDSGMVIITDNRVVTKRYGSIFLNSLPTQAKIYNSESDFFNSF